MKRVRIPRTSSEFTPSDFRRQKGRFSQSRGLNKCSRLFVHELPRLPGQKPRGIISLGIRVIRCAIGSKGIGVKRREGDSLTPTGKFRIIQWLVRADRPQSSRAGARPFSAKHGWCDDPQSFSYNRGVNLPCRQSYEELWRNDHLYDIIGVISFNIRPRILGRGSAIFLHAACPDLSSTAGCVALRLADLRKLRATCVPHPHLVVGKISLRRFPNIAEPTRILVAPN